MKTAIISGCDNNYFNQYLNLYYSLLDNECNQYADLCFVNISISEENLKKINKNIKKIVQPEWDFNLPFKTIPSKSMISISQVLGEFL